MDYNSQMFQAQQVALALWARSVWLAFENLLELIYSKL